MQLPSPLVLLLLLSYLLFILIALVAWSLLTYRRLPAKKRRQLPKAGHVKTNNRAKPDERPRYVPVVRAPREVSPEAKVSYAVGDGEEDVLADLPSPRRKRE